MKVIKTIVSYSIYILRAKLEYDFGEILEIMILAIVLRKEYV
jgi:hypothetical protein